jgi:maleylacetate reductase
MIWAPNDFVHDQRTLRVVFEAGALARLPEEIDHIGGKRVLVIASGRYLPRLTDLLGDRLKAVLDRPFMHVPVAQVEQVTAKARAADVDAAVAVGGGSAIGLAKALALRTCATVIGVPTTFSGSEMTRVWGITDDHGKTIGRDEVVAPRTVIYDPDLLATLPRGTAIPSAFNAVAHAVEALYAPDHTPITDLHATAGIRAIADAMSNLGGEDPNATAAALYGAWMCGMCLDATAMGLHHKLCHVLGGTLGLPHAPTHTAVLPHVLAFNGPAVNHTMTTLRHTLGAVDPANYLQDLARNHGATVALGELGMHAADAAQVVELVLKAPYANPRQPTKADLLALLHRALVGAPAVSNPADHSVTRC